jgi:hypothetical protein
MAKSRKISTKYKAVWIFLAALMILSMIAPLFAGRFY